MGNIVIPPCQLLHFPLETRTRKYYYYLEICGLWNGRLVLYKIKIMLTISDRRIFRTSGDPLFFVSVNPLLLLMLTIVRGRFGPNSVNRLSLLDGGQNVPGINKKGYLKG